jgi:hypothetical protein
MCNSPANIWITNLTFICWSEFDNYSFDLWFKLLSLGFTASVGIFCFPWCRCGFVIIVVKQDWIRVIWCWFVVYEMLWVDDVMPSIRFSVYIQTFPPDETQQLSQLTLYLGQLDKSYITSRCSTIGCTTNRNTVSRRHSVVNNCLSRKSRETTLFLSPYLKKLSKGDNSLGEEIISIEIHITVCSPCNLGILHYTSEVSSMQKMMQNVARIS